MNDLDLFLKKHSKVISGIFFDEKTKKFPPKLDLEVVKVSDLRVFWLEQEKLNNAKVSELKSLVKHYEQGLKEQEAKHKKEIEDLKDIIESLKDRMERRK